MAFEATPTRLRQMILEDIKTKSVNQNRMTIRAIRILPIPHLTGKIAGINITEACFFSDLRGTEEIPRRGIIRIRHFVVFVKCGNMPWDIG